MRRFFKSHMTLSSKHEARNAMHKTMYRNKVARFGGGSRSRYRKIMRKGAF
jgi:hypothetical protein